MIHHNIKIAFRNLTKYKTQTIISIIGLAVGFVCFALSALWIRYERSFDAFHPNAQHLYITYQTSRVGVTGSANLLAPYALREYMRQTFPEVKNVTTIWAPPAAPFNIANRFVPMRMMHVNEIFFDLFDIRILEGEIPFHDPHSRSLAVSAQTARRFFGNENPIGKIVGDRNWPSTITAVVSDWEGPSNFSFDFIGAMGSYPPEHSWGMWIGNVVFELYPTVDADAFLERFSNHVVRPDETFGNLTFSAIPLLSLRTNDEFHDGKNVKHQFIVWFSLIGLLVIACALFNYFTLFFSRFRIRQKEFALRMVCGANTKSLFSLLATEFASILVLAALLGLLLFNFFQHVFRDLSGVDLPLSAILLEMSVYFVGVILFALLLFSSMLLLLRRKALNAAIRRRKSSTSRRVSVVLQLVISMMFIFCTAITIKQLNYLHRVDNLGIDFNNTARLWRHFQNFQDVQAVYNQLRQIPEIETILTNAQPLFGRGRSRFLSSARDWEEKNPDSSDIVEYERFSISTASIEFYNLQLVAGRFLNENDAQNMVMINESAVRAFGWHEPIGKTFGFEGNNIVVGVLRNLQVQSPTLPVLPAVYTFNNDPFHQESWGGIAGGGIVFRYHEGTIDIVRRKVRDMLGNMVPQHYASFVVSANEEWAEHLRSENALLRLLAFVSLICILISVFGFFSLVSLTCEERRKEIALRKINGATIHDIVGIFFKEYATLLAIGALIAFPAGYYLMQRWLEQYVLQTPVPAWIYAAILLALSLVIVLCVGWRVWKASVENPAHVVKSD